MGRVETSLPLGSTMADLMGFLKIDFPLDALLLVVNGRVVETDYILQDNDRVHFMPAISGGGLKKLFEV